MSDGLGGQTVEAARRALAARFRAGAIDSAELDARMLLGAVLGLDLTGLIAAARRLLTAAEAARLEDSARRRLAGEPVARLVGRKEFWGLPLRLSAATLVPRPDTETVVELALELALEIRRGAGDPTRRLCIADLGTGSGAILLALLSELPDADGYGTDVSVAALRTARANAADLGLADRAAFIACDYAAALAGTFDLIVSNPPYIRSAAIRRPCRRGARSRPAWRAGRRHRRTGRLPRPDSAGGAAIGATGRPHRGGGARPERRYPGIDDGGRVNAGTAAESRSGGDPAGGRGPQTAPCSLIKNAKNHLEYSPGATTFRLQHRSRVAGPVDTPKGYCGWRPEFSKREPAPSERFQNAGPIERDG